MIYLKAFETVLPKNVENHLDVGTGESFRFSNIITSKNLLCSEINRSDFKTTPMPFFAGDALQLSVFLKEKFFNLVTCFDMIEHLEKNDGFTLIKTLEKLTNDRIIFFTPLGPVGIHECKEQYHTHLSGWFPEDFVKLGYKCWVFPNFHKKIGFGAFFAIKSKTSITKKRLEGLDEIFEGEFWI